MKKWNLLISLLFSLHTFGTSQIDTQGEKDSYFFALIVDNIDSSISWYSKILDFTVLDRNDVPARSLSQANLKRGNLLLELIELGSSLPVSDALANEAGKSRLQGFFKVGFSVSNFENSISQWQQLGVNFRGDAVINHITGKKMVTITDPDGNRIQIFDK